MQWRFAPPHRLRAENSLSRAVRALIIPGEKAREVVLNFVKQIVSGLDEVCPCRQRVNEFGGETAR